MINVIAILCADIHLRPDRPRSRTDDYLKAQAKKLHWLGELSIKHKAPIIEAGDLLHSHKANETFINYMLEHIPFMYVVPGNHDLPKHRLDLLKKSALWTLQESGKISIITKPTQIDQQVRITPFPAGCPPKPLKTRQQTTVELAVCHTMVWDKRPYPDAPAAGNVKRFLKSVRGYDIVLTGDNHVPFEYKNKNGTLINAGCMMRMTVKERQHKPRVYLLYNDLTYEPIFFPIQKGVLTEETENTSRGKMDLDVFIRHLENGSDIGSSFHDNLEAAFSKHPPSKECKEIIMEAIHG